MQIEPSLSSHFVEYIRDYLLDNQVDPEPILTAQGLPLFKKSDNQGSVSLSKIINLFETAQKQTNDDYIGLNLAQRYHYESAGLITALTLSAPSVKEGILTLCRYDKYLDTAIIARFSEKQDFSEFSIDIINPENLEITQLVEFLACFFVDMLNKATRKNMPIREVYFSHVSGKDDKPLEEFLGAKIKFNQKSNSIIFASDYLSESFFTSNRLMYETLQEAYKTHFFADTNQAIVNLVVREMMSGLSNGIPSLTQIAENLAMTERTLKRHLSEAGSSFQEVKTQARARLAKYYLEHTAETISEIAYRLGYSEVSAFSRAFRSWMDSSPQDYRVKNHKSFISSS